MFSYAKHRQKKDGVKSPKMCAVLDIDDTLISDETFGWRAIPSVIRLYRAMKTLGCKVFLVTAREDAKDVVDWTKDQLRVVGITDQDGLYLCPRSSRDSMAAVGKWKASMRKKLAKQFGGCVVLTVGDQWTDIVEEKDAGSIDAYAKYDGLTKDPYCIVRTNDKVSIWGLKLKAKK